MECNLYLAPSSIPGAGMGIFSGSKAFEIGDHVSFGDIVIPIFEFKWHNGFTNPPFLWDGTFLFDIILVSLLMLCCGLSPRGVSDSLNLSPHRRFQSQEYIWDGKFFKYPRECACLLIVI
jgi:hypothetical protein